MELKFVGKSFKMVARPEMCELLTDFYFLILGFSLFIVLVGCFVCFLKWWGGSAHAHVHMPVCICLSVCVNVYHMHAGAQ